MRSIGGWRFIARCVLFTACAAAIALAAWTRSARADIVDFSNFVANSNGAPGYAGPTFNAGMDTVTMTTAVNSEAGSIWYNGTSGPGGLPQQSITNFVANFTYTDGSNGGADGVAFVLQNSGTTALGGAGGSIGYQGIASSAADVFNIFSGQGGSTTVYSNASNFDATLFRPTGQVFLGTQNRPINVTLSYTSSNQTLVERMVDTVKNTTSFKVYTGINIPTDVGGNTAFVGFTGGTGGVNAIQSISNFSFTTGNAPPVPGPARFQPITLTGFTQQMVINNGGSTVTATMDGGIATTGNTWYERGVNSNVPQTGLPPAGLVPSISDPDHAFFMQDYGGNDAVLLDSDNGGPVTLVLSTPAKFGGVSFLTSSGNGAQTFTATLHFSDGSSTTLTGIASPDWFNVDTTPAGIVGYGRGALDGTFANVSTPNPRLYEEDVSLNGADANKLLSSIDLTYTGTATGHTAIFAISGAVPEPASGLALAAMATLSLLRRRRQRSEPPCEA